MKDVYQQLAKHLDNLPAGFPATESGVELRILKRMFTAQEAEVALGLTMFPEPAPAIAQRLEKDPDQIAQMLSEMSKKGLIFRMQKNGNTLFMAAQFVIGIWEYHVNDLDEELIRDFNEYVPHLMKKTWEEQKTKQLRVIPVSQSIDAPMHVMPYDAAEEIIKKQSKIVVAPCICRKEHSMVGKGCGKLMETCLVFGGGAYFYEENGLGRSIDSDEALKILEQGIEAGLVLQPGNSQKPMNICMCCGDCCQILKNLNTLEAPAHAIASNYIAVVDEETCTGCSACEELCQMGAIEMSDTAQVLSHRCIGCGLCVTGCEFDAIRVMEKEEKTIPPPNTVQTYISMAQERGLF